MNKCPRCHKALDLSWGLPLTDDTFVVYCKCGAENIIFAPGYREKDMQEESRNMESKTKVQKHKELCDFLNDLYARKNADYGDSFHKSFVDEGMAMPRIRLGDKYNRFCTLSRGANPAQVNDESMRDTLIDLANYALMTVLELDAEAGQT